jgi:NAD(P)H-dependent FMN reductase
MVEILGLVGSARTWGNGELLVRQVLRGAIEEGAGGCLLRLTDLHLEGCTGCMRCAIARQPCPLDDDLDWLLDTMLAAGGLVLAAPTYFLAPAAAIKLVLDRLLTLAGRYDEALPPLRPAVTLATAGLERWRGVVLPYLNALAATTGYRPIESILAVAPGPGEVLLDEAVMQWAWEAGRRLGRGELEPGTAPHNICPTCRCDAFVLEDEGATCPICGRRARIELAGGKPSLYFDTQPEAGPRWSAEAWHRHIDEWVVATGERFLARREEIRTRRAPYRSVPIPWLAPPAREKR